MKTVSRRVFVEAQRVGGCEVHQRKVAGSYRGLVFTLERTSNNFRILPTMVQLSLNSKLFCSKAWIPGKRSQDVPRLGWLLGWFNWSSEQFPCRTNANGPLCQVGGTLFFCSWTPTTTWFGALIAFLIEPFIISYSTLQKLRFVLVVPKTPDDSGQCRRFIDISLFHGSLSWTPFHNIKTHPRFMRIAILRGSFFFQENTNLKKKQFNNTAVKYQKVLAKNGTLKGFSGFVTSCLCEAILLCAG